MTATTHVAQFWGMDSTDRPLRILIVDDDAADRMMIRRILQRTNLELTAIAEVTYGAEAIATLTQARYDCVFLDYRLPDIDGLQLIQQLKSQGLTLPLIVLTGQGDQEIAVQLMKAGASDYVVKSRLNPDLIAQCIRGALRIYEAEEIARHAQQEIQITNALLLQQNQAVEEHRRQIQRQNLELVRASRLKSEFLATMSHELRTPMNAIIGFSQLLLRRRNREWTEQQADMVHRINSNAHHLLTLLNEILDFSKLDARRLELRPVPMNLALLAKETLAEMQSLATEKSLTLTLDLQLAQPIIHNDPARLRQVLTNLISNAIKFTDVGGVEVAIAPDPAAPDTAVVVAVTDTGKGISPEELNYIFEAFRQVDQSATRKHTGTGLGLAIVDSLVTLMGGSITVTSEPGQGTTFAVSLPQCLPQTAAATDTSLS